MSRRRRRWRCTSCRRLILELTDETADSGLTLHTSVFVGGIERRYHWPCFEGLEAAAP